MTEWTQTRFAPVRLLDDRGHLTFTVWDFQTNQAVPHPRGKRRRYSMREAFSVSDTLNQHPAFRTEN